MAPLEIKVASDPAQLADCRRAVESFAASCGFDECGQHAVGLVVNEAMANVIRHAYHGARDKPMVVKAEYGSEKLKISIRDWGNGVDPSTLPPRENNPLEPGGLGILCMKEIMDEVDFKRQPDGMLLEMTRSLRKAGCRCHDAGDAR